MERRSFRVRDAIEAADTDHDFILIDCPPALGLLTLNALSAADAVLVPLQCEFFALEGLSQLLRTVDRVKRNFNPDLELTGVVLTMFDKRNNLSEQVAADARGHLGDKVYDTIIPAQRAHFRGTVARQACLALRSQVRRKPGLHGPWPKNFCAAKACRSRHDDGGQYG